MSYERNGGKQCVVVGCITSQKKLHCWGQEICEDHDIKHADCPCLVPYKLLCLPKDDQKRRSWLKEINKGFQPICKISSKLLKFILYDVHFIYKFYVHLHISLVCGRKKGGVNSAGSFCNARNIFFITNAILKLVIMVTVQSETKCDNTL